MAIREALLALVQAEPKFGLQLKTEFETYTGEIWPLNVGQVYSTLSRLERDGLVQVDGGADAEAGQKVYSITTAGSESLDDWLHSGEPPTTPPRNELVIKIMIAITMEQIDVHQVIQAHRRPLLESMQSVTKLKIDATATATLLAADAELFRLEAAVRWLDTVETRLRHGGQLDRPTIPTSQLEQQSQAESSSS